jgi:hypothetical protein
MVILLLLLLSLSGISALHEAPPVTGGRALVPDVELAAH